MAPAHVPSTAPRGAAPITAPRGTLPSTAPHRAAPITGLLASVLLTSALLAGCSAVPAGLSAPPTPTATTGTTPAASEPVPATTSPSPTGPASDAIRSLDPAALEWQWFDNFAEVAPIDVTAPDEFGRTYTLGDPVYSDADGDGLEDMAVPLAQLDGNGYREQWFVWVADGDGGATQMTVPIAWTARCGDVTRSVKATEGGFVVRERLREPVIDDHLPCSKPGTFASTRTVGVLHEGDGLYPVNLADPRGYGGVCPTHPRTETGVVKVWGSAVPTLAAPLTIDGERLYLIQTSAHTLTTGADPLRLVSVWPRDGHSDQRLCVWIDPVRFEGSGE